MSFESTLALHRADPEGGFADGMPDYTTIKIGPIGIANAGAAPEVVAEKEAIALERALRMALPGNTYDLLLTLMLRAREGLLNVQPHRYTLTDQDLGRVFGALRGLRDLVQGHPSALPMDNLGPLVVSLLDQLEEAGTDIPQGPA